MIIMVPGGFSFFKLPAELVIIKFFNPHSLKTIKAYVEPGLKSAKPGDHFQFQRQGYFVLDKDSSSSKLIFNKTVGLRDTWSKQKE